MDAYTCTLVDFSVISGGLGALIAVLVLVFSFRVRSGVGTGTTSMSDAVGISSLGYVVSFGGICLSFLPSDIP